MKKAFTLVELIVVITILAILWTISFISLSWYSAEARDSKRLSDTTSLLSKINIENTRWVPLSDLITERKQATLQILWEKNENVWTMWIANFENLKENRENFKDPFYKNQDYYFAYAIWWTGTWAYKFIQTATISEKENKTVLKWNYYKSIAEDADSLFVKWIDIFKNNDDKLIYWEWWWNNTWNNEESFTCINPDNVTDEDLFSMSWNTLISYNWTSTDIVIPCKIKWENVEKIWNNFYCVWLYYICWTDTKTKTPLTSVVIPNSVKSIWQAAFYGNQLENIIIPPSVTNISDLAFAYNIFTDLELPDSITNIWFWTFWGGKIENLKLGKFVKTIWNGAFSSNQISWELIIPNTVEKIDENAFFWNKITILNIPDKVESIWKNAFSNNEIKNLKIWNWVKTIWESAFQFNKFETFDLWNSVINIWNYAFYHVELNWKLVLPNTLETLWTWAFSTNWLTELETWDSLKVIWDYAFLHNKLTSIKIWKNLNTLWASAFSNNLLAWELIIPDNVKSLWERVFSTNTITSVLIWNWVQDIWDYAFNTNSLAKVKLWTSVESIWNGAFGSQLSSVWNWRIYWSQILKDKYYNTTYFHVAKLPNWEIE